MEWATCDFTDLRNSHTNLSLEQLWTYFSQVFSAIEYLHEQRIAHNDIKLDNIFYYQEQNIVKLADFGFSSKGLAEPATAAKQAENWTDRLKDYQSPEISQLLEFHRKPIDELKCDIFAFAVNVFVAVTSMMPFYDS